jgi:endoglucanase
MKSLIQKLTEIPGPSGYEAQIRNAIRDELKSYADEIRVDNLGNLIVRKGQRLDGGLRIMLSAHVDEIGVMVTHVDERGFLRFLPLGGVRPQSCLGGRVRFMNGAMGVIGAEQLSNPTSTPAFEQLYIDTGVGKRQDSKVGIGDVAVFERPFLDLGQRWVAKAMDDRVGVAILMETLRELHQSQLSSPHEFYFVFSSQEEVGLRGATTAAFGIDPDVGLAVDVTAVGDTPQGIAMDVALGKGPAIKVRDQRILADPRVVDWMVKTAEKARLPFQLEILKLGSTDASAIQLTRAGVLAGCLSIPCRYVHTPSEMVDQQDVENAVKLMVALLSKPLEI